MVAGAFAGCARIVSSTNCAAIVADVFRLFLVFEAAAEKNKIDRPPRPIASTVTAIINSSNVNPVWRLSSRLSSRTLILPSSSAGSIPLRKRHRTTPEFFPPV
jgi:hypothetical protein